uniref:F-box domain-containing protein n=1 Tax=Acrobeloides nanus TaxID=290746 RepID=A0A914C372_9BILA
MNYPKQLLPEFFVDILQFLKREDINEFRLVNFWWNTVIINNRSALPLGIITVALNEFEEVHISKEEEIPHQQNNHKRKSNGGKKLTIQVHADRAHHFLKNNFIQKLYLFFEVHTSLKSTIAILQTLVNQNKKPLKIGTFKPFISLTRREISQLSTLEVILKDYIRAEKIILPFGTRRIIKEPALLPMTFMPKEVLITFTYFLSNVMTSRDVVNFIRFHNSKNGIFINNYDKQPGNFHQVFYEYFNDEEEMIPSFKIEFLNNPNHMLEAIESYMNSIKNVCKKTYREHMSGWTYNEIIYTIKGKERILKCSVSYYNYKHGGSASGGAIYEIIHL